MTVNRDLGKLTPIPSVAGQFVWNQATTSWQQVTKAMVGLGSVDNTADTAKPVSTAQQAALDLKANLAGAAFTGSVSIAGTLTTGFNVTVDRSSGSAAILLTSPAATQRLVYFRTAGVDRWRVGASAVAESGSNAGSDFTFDRYSDAGVGLGTALTINRSTGETTVPLFTCSGPLKPGQYTLTTLPSASAYNGYEIDVTNATGGSKRCRSNGSVWQILNTTTTVS
jgi:hypothetical protein